MNIKQIISISKKTSHNRYFKSDQLYYRIRRCLVPSETTDTLSNSGGTRQRWFLLLAFTLKNISINKTLVNQIFLICYDYIKNNSNINLGNGSQIRFVWSWSNTVKMHNVLYIPLKIFGNWSSIYQNFNRI